LGVADFILTKVLGLVALPSGIPQILDASTIMIEVLAFLICCLRQINCNSYYQ
jgi:hypothetical protein